MRYRFITIFHNLKLNFTTNKGKEIFSGARISNGPEVLASILETDLMKGTAGVHSIREYNDKTYFYVDGELKDIHTREQMDKVGNQYTFFFLRQAQKFALQLWEIKDNGIYVRDGFLLAYSNNFEDGCTYKASLSEIFPYSNCKMENLYYSNI